MISYQDKKVTVVGLARSGLAAARLLKKLGADVTVTEAKRSEQYECLARELGEEGVVVELGGHSRAAVAGRDLLVLSPGARLDALPVVWAGEEHIEIVSELELAASVCPATIIAITGTNGKTTTTTLVGDVLKAAGRRAFVLGNIGMPFSAKVLEMKKEDYVSLEVSSFQLETIHAFHPRVAVILNLTPDHLDRYRDVADYLEAKKRVYMNQDRADWLILNETDAALRALAAEAPARVLFFGKNAQDAEFDQNQQAVLAVAAALGLDRRACLEVFKNFKGVEHRIEFVRVLDGVEYLNDSKATNIDSTVWALRNIKKPVVLIAGGRDKGSDFASIGELVRQKVKFVVLTGEASDRIAAAWHDVVLLEQVTTFEQAVRRARQHARTGDCVLFSPMCKSFDMFTDYEHRGRTFKEIVGRLR
ncbi:UDP-N-acetylmuramoylalanine--D-glutamate ligase [Candidatus Velamenicoccus archaeovorus]|uniref:UDP-N-acetylmuramoylalanine--D-glutamate ligase n=1 Tax=Velamenicoccus archaeovorus TaxID=1930593 RepID=A0A410P505_VELA1|nr:Mur ligase family protein [Candidatus Velamenicoccus archaeovorus]QAT17269.1 UDP-N-acetylmuramoylalanine--D-glutamate ligase [Candidatus Velamenicoccus archaeovorus]